MQEYNSPESWAAAIAAQARLPDGFRLATSALEFIPQERPEGKPYPMRLSLVMADKPTTAFAGMFTRNAFPGAPVLVGREMLKGSQAQAILINNKVSNVGSPTGVADSRALCAGIARECGIDPKLIFPSSTGIIGWSLPVPAMSAALPGLAAKLGIAKPLDIARSIMTTDSYPKAFSVDVGSGTIFGFAKGAGMIEPNMATMLVFILTDLDQPRAEMQTSLEWAVNQSFNCISVDSDQSTSDSCLMLSSQRAPAVSASEFDTALLGLCRKLAGHIVRNGEGTAHVMRVRVSGLGDAALCRDAGKAIVNSPLVKTAMYGNDPNVGRLISSLGDFLGNRGLPLPADRLRLSLCGTEVFSHGAFYLSAQTEIILSAALKNARQDPTVQGYPQHERYVDIEVTVDPVVGADATPVVVEVLGSDLGYEYVKENADYRS